MKQHFALLLLVILATGLCVTPVFAQTGTVKGVCKDSDGNPVVGGVLVWTNQDNGQKYTLKTNKHGEYFSLGVTPGKYNVALYKTPDDQKANKEMDKANGFQVKLDENNLDFDVKKEQAEQAKGVGLTPEQLKQMQEAKAKQEKEVNTVKSLNQKLNDAKTSADSGDYDTAIADLTAANQVDPSRDLIWYKLGDYYRMSAPKQSDPAEKQKRYESAIDDYQKAIELKEKTPDKDPIAQGKNLAAYYNNLGEAYARSNKLDDAIKSYDSAAKADPTSAGNYYFNEGAVLTNAGKIDDAIAAFDKCIAADPSHAEAYYQKGVNLMGKATLKGDKTIPAPGTIEAFQKYLEMAPNGPNAQTAKDMLASLGSTVETTFGKKKAAKK